MAPLDGTFQLAPLASTSTINSASGAGGRSSHNTVSTTIPPKAIFLKLTPAALQHLRSLNNATGRDSRIPGLGIEIGANNGQPTALNIGESSYSIARHPSTAINAGLVTDLIGPSSLSNDKGKGRATTTTTTFSGQALSLLASGCKEQYGIQGGPVARKVAPKEKTAENMGERMRERVAQLEKEKEARKVVMVDDSVLLPNGKKGKGKKANGHLGAKASASPLLRASAAIPAKRASSPAGISPRNSPLLGASSATRPPNRLVANEAAKGLMSRKEKERVEQQAKDAAAAALQKQEASSQTLAPKPAAVPAVSQPISTVQSDSQSTATNGKIAEKIRVASSTSSTSSYSSASASTQASTSTAASSIGSIPIGPPPITKPTGISQSTLAARPGQPQKYHKAKVDEDDLASASSSDEGDDLIPLAKRVNSPVKALPPPLPTPAVQAKAQPVAPKASAVKAVPKPAATIAKKTATPPKDKEPERPKPRPSNPLPPPPASLSVDKAPVSSGSSRASSSDRSSASRSPPASTNGSKRKHDAVDFSLQMKEGDASARLQVPEAKKPRNETGSARETAPRTQGRTSGGTRLSKPLPRRTSGGSNGSRSTSPGPPAQPAAPLPAAAAPVAAVPTIEETSSFVPSPQPQLQSQPAKYKPSMSLSITPAVSPQRSSRGSSPLPPSPGGHPLPAKPVDISHNKSPRLGATKPYTDTGRLSAPPSPVPSSRSSSVSHGAGRPAPPPSLPAKPSTTMPPFGRSFSTTSSYKTSKPVQEPPAPAAPAPSHVPVSSAGNSPIVSNFSKRPFESLPVSRENSVSSANKRKPKEVFEKGESSAKKAKKSSKINVEFTSSEEEDGEADEDAEGEAEEEDGEYGDVSAPPAVMEGERGRSAEKKTVTSANPANKWALPSFSKKGRTSELSAIEGKNGVKSQPVSRAQTPNSGDHNGRSESPQVKRNRSEVSISSDSEFNRFSKRFSEDLFPAYSKLHRRLEDVQSSLKSNGRQSAGVTAADLAKMVEDANERGKELESIRAAMQRYNQQKERAARAVQVS